MCSTHLELLFCDNGLIEVGSSLPLRLPHDTLFDAWTSAGELKLQKGT